MPNRKKHTATVAVFETKARADQAVADLRAAGFDESKIGLVYRDADGKTVKTGAADETYAEEGAVAGAVAGAAGGALVGAGILAGVIPVIGPVLALGTLGTVLVNAAGGAALIGITGALVGWGIPEEDAEFYEQEVQGGRYLVTVEANGRALEARDILHRRSGFDRQGWTAVRADRANILSEGGFHTEDGRVIQLKEEQLRADKEQVSAGEVKVRKEVHTEQRQLTVPVEREEVVIERHPAEGGLKATGNMSAEEIRIPVKEERVKVTKEPVVTEEVTVGKRKVRENRTVSGTVRKEEAVVESTGGAKVNHTSKPGKK
ncbi:YsnF/AvaK domain-containing protein [Frigoriglobus tundricola]|uniref:DUF2382 domain-containing protein n=1 Tax=Frigoriglobus tundricola TaxID=2774151 RepID=A0A6M5YMT3_9BACT|nr:YsnF/AvaK domain-containing protein [Frigoriglobus tundricola]QJW94541.1 hypothetical protein FTUN_2062 [Frigoriglobus tundricola]